MPKKRRPIQRLIIGISFLVFSIILVINNTTQLFQTIGIPLTQMQIVWIVFIAMLISAIWAVILAAFGEFN